MALNFFTPGSGRLPDKPNDMSQADYDQVLDQEFHPSAGDGRNVHFGPTSNHSTGCVLVGSSYIVVRAPFDGDRFGLAKTNGLGAIYSVPGFGLQDTIDSQFKLLRAIQCARKQGATVKYKVLNSPPPRHPQAAAEPERPPGEDGIPYGRPQNF
jgi:hypothetical protein